MTRHPTIRLRRLISACSVAIVFSPAAVPAQTEIPDARWQAWLGCWRPADALGNADAPGNDGAPAPVTARQAPLLCIVPSSSGAVDFVSVDAGTVLSTTTLDASRAPMARERDGCSGTEGASFSPDGRRIYLRSDHSCPGNLQRTSNGLLAIAPSGELLDVQGVSVGGLTTIRVVRLRDAGVPSYVPVAIADALKGRGFAIDAARAAAGGVMTEGDIVDASRALDATVVRAWLVERGHGFALDAQTLLRLARAGVSGVVTDIMVALSNPRAFSIRRSPTGSEVASMPGRAAGSDGYRGDRVYLDAYGGPYGSHLLGYPYAVYGATQSLYGYGYGGHGLRGYGGYYNQPVIFIVPGGSARSRGRVVNGRGYTQDPGTTGANREPRSPSPSGTGGSAGGSGSSGTAQTGERKAKPRP